MTSAAVSSKNSRGTVAGAPLNDDARILRQAILESVDTSPDAFLAEAEDLEAKPADYWENEIKSATWAVVQRGDEILGIAAARRPDPSDMAYALPGEACFIQSVWIHPSMRGTGLSRNLVNFLIDIQRTKGIRQFFLWVFKENSHAIKLYIDMDFKYAYRSNKHRLKKRGTLVEVQYMRAFDSAVIEEAELADNAKKRNEDPCSDGVAYRLLGCEAS